MSEAIEQGFVDYSIAENGIATITFGHPLSNSRLPEQLVNTWMAYRKALREIKLQEGFPDTIHWPNKPE